MSVTPKALIKAKFATSADEYTVPASTTTIIDKFTAFNSDATDRTLSIYLIPSGESAADSNRLIKDYSITAGATAEFSSIQNQILSAGDIIRVVPSWTGVISIRCSGREVI